MTAGAERTKIVYEELLRVEQHWTAQVRDQQSRITTILTVNGFLLGLIAGLGLVSNGLPRQTWYGYVFLACIATLCLAVVFGTLALKPSIGIAGVASPGMKALHQTPEPAPLWLDASAIRAFHHSDDEEGLFRALAESVGRGQEETHADVMAKRRAHMYREITLIWISMALLLVSLGGWWFD
jgi:hypothetical protein